MSWLPPWLAKVYARLYRVEETRPFELAAAIAILDQPSHRAGFALSRLVRFGWAVRERRAAYRLVHPQAVVALEGSGAWERFGRSPAYPALALSTSEVFRSWGSNLLSLALFGSVARSEIRPESDVDLLAVVRTLPNTWTELSRQIAIVEGATHAWNRTLWSRHRERHAIELVVMDPEILRTEPKLLLDLTEDAYLLWDPERVLATALDRVRTRLRARGSRRVRLGQGRSFWDLTPGRARGPIEAL